MTNHKVSDFLGVEHPIVQGPFGGGLSTIELTSLVSNMGGLGSYGAHFLEPQGVESVIQELRRTTGKPFAINLWVSDHDPEALDFSKEAFEAAWRIFEPLYAEFELEKPQQPTRYHPNFEAQMEAVLEARPPILSFVFGVPSAKLLEACRQRQIRTVGAVTTLTEAEIMHEAGVDVIVTSGFEAGGHRPSFVERAEDSLMGTQALTRIVSHRLPKPVIAAGGVVDGLSVRASLQAGASAAQLGTAFLACEESGTSDTHRHALRHEQVRDTILTRAYTGRLARGAANRLTAEMEKHAGRLPPFPVQAWFVSPLKKAALATDNEDFLSLYASQATPIVKHRHAAELMHELVNALD